MEKMEKEALVFIHALEKLYLEQRDMENILNLIDERTSWIGTGKQEICENLSEAAEALFAEQAEYKGGFAVRDSWYKTEILSPDACVIFGEFWADAKDKNADVAPLHHRISIVCARSIDGMKMVHLHMSNHDDDQTEEEFYVKKRAKLDNRTLRDRFEETEQNLYRQNREMEILTSNIPGGVHQTKNDEGLTLLSMSSGFINMFGYSAQEIADRFNNRFMEMVYEKDREAFVKIVKEQLSHGETVEFEYRVPCKNGKLIWILDRGRLVVGEDGQETFFCVMVDITERKEEQEEMRLLLERHKIIMDQTTDILFEWDIATDVIDFSTNWEKKFGYLPISQYISKKILLSRNIHPEDMCNFTKIMKDVAAGMPYSEAEFRIRSVSRDYTWCRIRATTQFDSNNNPVKAIGVIIDIDSEKNKSKELMDAAQKDTLTKLYNKGATKARVEKILEDKSDAPIHAMMIIDVDNFKSINDTFGHQCGDAVLSNMAQALKKLFRATDIIGRIGGDEFLAFMPNLNDSELAEIKAKAIVEIFKDMPIGVEAEISCSVGVSLYPKDAEDYAGLSHCADSALYKVKKSGKVNFAFYEKDMQNTMPEYIVRTAINSGHAPNNSHQEDIVQQIFEVLYNAKDIKSAISHSLEVVGRVYDVSRVYVFETSEDGQWCKNTFEWCSDGISPEIENLQKLSFDTDLKGFFDMYDDNGVFYCQNINNLKDNLQQILKAQGISSVLQCFIQDEGVFKGYVGFDECRENRYWTKEQIKTLTLVSNMLSIFLTKERMKKQIALLNKTNE